MNAPPNPKVPPATHADCELAIGMKLTLRVSFKTLKPPLTVKPMAIKDIKVLETIKEGLIGVTKHSDAFKIFEKYGIVACSQALTMFGYKVKWSGLDPENAEIVRI